MITTGDLGYQSNRLIIFDNAFIGLLIGESILAIHKYCFFASVKTRHLKYQSICRTPSIEESQVPNSRAEPRKAEIAYFVLVSSLNTFFGMTFLNPQGFLVQREWLMKS